MNTIFSPQLRERQKLAVSLLESAISKQKLAHSYLLLGRADADKDAIALETACFLNCCKEDKWQTGACAKAYFSHNKTDNLCQNCRWLTQRQHPQAWFSLEGDEGKVSGIISVEGARRLSHELAKTSQFFRVIVVPDASESIFHRPAANALLKTIEEPGANTIFFLFADALNDVLATIVSRCQVIPTIRPAGFGLWKNEKIENKPKQGDAEETPPLSFELKTRLSPQLKMQHGNHMQYLQMAKEIIHLVDENKSDDLRPSEVVSAIVDFIAASEIDRFAETARQDESVHAYLSSLLTLAETAKEHVDHYVSTKAAIEAFSLSLRDLKEKHARELSLGKAG